MAKLGKILPLFLLLGIYLAASFGKVILTKASPYFDEKDETGLFWTENALQYTYAKRVAQGKGVPEWDQNVQYPEGLRVAEEFTTTLEIASGTLYRWLSRLGLSVPFHVFAVYFVSFVSSLSVLPLYFFSRRLWDSPLAALLIALFYVVMPPSFLRTIAGFTREDFALPFLFTGLVCFALSLEEDRPWLPWAAGVSMGLGLASWHLSPFILTLLVFYCAAAYFLHSEKSALLIRNFAILILCVAVAGVAFPVLRNKHMLISSSMLLAYGLLLSHGAGAVCKWDRKIRFVVFLSASAVLLFLVSHFTLRSYKAYAHAFELVFYKILYLGQKPANPNAISYEARSLWMSSFSNATLYGTWIYFSSLLVLAPVAQFLTVRRLLKEKRASAWEVTVFFCIVFFVLYLLISRLWVFLIFFMALSVGEYFIAFPKRRLWVALALALCIGWEIHNDTRLQIAVARPPNDKETISWIRNHTKPDDVILAPCPFSPSIYAYAGRPIVIHPKWDSHVVRDKIREFKEALFQDEEAFYRLCRKWGARYYMHEAPIVLDTSRSSPRYEAGLTVIPRRSAAYGFHFAPERLKHFALAYQNAEFRIFKIESPAGRPDTTLPYQPLFDIALFDPEGRGETFDDSRIPDILPRLNRPEFRYALGERLYREGRYRDAALQYGLALQASPGLARAHIGLGNSLSRMGARNDARRQFLQAVRLNPNVSPDLLHTDDAAVFREIAEGLLKSDRLGLGVTWLQKTLSVNPDDLEARHNLGVTYLAGNEPDRARKQFEEILRRSPDYAPAHKLLGIVYREMGRHQNAIPYLKKFTTLAPNDPDAAAIRRYIEEMEKE